MFGREDKVSQVRLTIAQYAIVGIFLVLAFGLWRLQVMDAERYDTLAQQNRVKEVPILAARGKLLDREGRIIVDNHPSYSALLLRNKETKFSDATLEAIARGLNLDPEDLKSQVRRLSAMPGYQPIFIKHDMTSDELAFVEAHRNEFPELDTIMVARRLYPRGGFMAHLIGYVGEVNNEMLNQERYSFYNAGDIVGQSGVEAQYNDLLMGKNGSKRVLVNSKGKEVGELSDTPAVPGQAVKLTVDIDLQIAAEEALGDQNGAVIAMDPHTGEVLAMVSRPAFDPNAFSVRISRKDWNDLINNPAKPLLNKAIQAQLAPGSTFKVIMSVAGLQSKTISKDAVVVCNGGGTYYGRFFKCDEKHGPVNMSRAISVSCDTYFYSLGERLGIGKIAQFAQAFGLGQKTGIDLPQEVSGIMPSEEWKVRNYKQKWYAGETISVSIGQGAVAVTPIQLARALGGVAMGGVLRRPHVVIADDLPKNWPGAEHFSDEQRVEIDPENWDLITDAMADVTVTGTASMAKLPGIDFAGKTGTAQTISLEARKKMGAGGKAFEDNSWFVGVTPRRNPQIVVAVLSQGAGWGWRSGVMASKIIKTYVEKQRLREPSFASVPGQGQPAQTPGQTNAAPTAPAPGGATKPSARNHRMKQEVEISAVWSDGGADDLQAGRFAVRDGGRSSGSHPFRRAIAAPGMEGHATQVGFERSSSPSDHRKPRRERWPSDGSDVLATLPAPVLKEGGGDR